MHKANKFLAFFNIQPGEEHLIGLLVLLAFALELALVLLQSMAFGLFLEEYGQQSLPYSYIVIAVFGTLAAVISIKAAERVSFSMALMLNILFLGVFSTFIWLGLKSTFFHPVVFILPLSSLEENAMVSPAAPEMGYEAWEASSPFRLDRQVTVHCLIGQSICSSRVFDPDEMIDRRSPYSL